MNPRSTLKIGAAVISVALIGGAVWFIGITPPAIPLASDAPKMDAAVKAEATSSRRAVEGRDAEEPATAASSPDAPLRTAAARAVAPPAVRSSVNTRGGLPAAGEAAPHADSATRLRALSPDVVGDSNAAVENETVKVQDGNRPPASTAIPPGLAALAATAKPAEEVTEVGDARQTMEETLLAAKKKADNPAEPNVTARNAMDRLIGAFVSETDAEAKQDFLGVGQELAISSGASLDRLLSLALQPQQPIDVQRQALYLAADRDPALVQKVAANAAHPLQLEAESFLLEKQIAAGVRGTVKDTAPAP